MSIEVGVSDTDAIRDAIARLGRLLPRQVWAVTIEGQTLKVEELMYGTLKRISREETADRVTAGLEGEVLVGNLLASAAAYADRIARAAADQLGIKVEIDKLSAKALLAMFDMVDDDVPETGGANQPDPTAGVAVKTPG